MIQTSNISLPARSVILSALLGMQPPELPVAQLIRLAGLFTCTPNGARVAISRMLNSQEIEKTEASWYRLGAKMITRQQRQLQSLQAQTVEWDGQWHIVAVITIGSTPRLRTGRRQALRFFRLGELRDGIWLRPTNLDMALTEVLRNDCAQGMGSFQNQDELATKLWTLSSWAQEANQLFGLMKKIPRNESDLASGFVLSARVLRHFQHDPLLPTQLLPKNWPGTRLRSRYGEYDSAYRGLLHSWVDAQKTS